MCLINQTKILSDYYGTPTPAKQVITAGQCGVWKTDPATIAVYAGFINGGMFGEQCTAKHPFICEK